VQLLPRSYLVLRLGIQLPLEDLRPTYLEWILVQVAIPFRPILGSLLLLLQLLLVGSWLLIQQGMVLLDGQGGVDLGARGGIGSHFEVIFKFNVRIWGFGVLGFWGFGLNN
jgi:hypothetical protein